MKGRRLREELGSLHLFGSEKGEFKGVRIWNLSPVMHAECECPVKNVDLHTYCLFLLFILSANKGEH